MWSAIDTFWYVFEKALGWIKRIIDIGDMALDVVEMIFIDVKDNTKKGLNKQKRTSAKPKRTPKKKAA